VVWQYWRRHGSSRLTAWQLARPGSDGRASTGARFRIVEAFARNPDFYIGITDRVTRLDFVGYRLSLEVSRLSHDFAAVDSGTRYVSTLTIGTASPALRAVLNPVIHNVMFTEAMGHAWLQHNVEEVGLLEHILPQIYPGRTPRWGGMCAAGGS
jgi:hypothetical protein